MSIKIEEGKAELEPFYKEITDSVLEYGKYLQGNYKDFENIINKLAPKVDNGFLAVGISTREGLLGTKILLTASNKMKNDHGELEVKYQLAIEIYNRPIINSPISIPAYEKLVEDVKEERYVPSTGTIVAISTIAIGGLILLVYGGEIIAALGATVVAIGGTIVTVAEALNILIRTAMGIYSQLAG